MDNRDAVANDPNPQHTLITSALHDPITIKSRMLTTLYEAKKEGKVVGIYSKHLSDRPCLTAVVGIGAVEDDVMVSLIGYDVHGYFYEKDKLSLNEISGIVMLEIKFSNPFMKRLVSDKSIMTLFKDPAFEGR